MTTGSFVPAVPILAVAPNPVVVAAYHLVAVPNPVVVVAYHLVAVPNPVVVAAYHLVAAPIQAVGVHSRLAWRHNSGKIWFQG